MAIIALLNMLLSVGFANVIVNGNPAFRDGDTLFAPNVNGNIIAHRIVNMTSEIDVPGTPDKINVTGTAEQVVAYINTNFPDYVWPDVEDLNTTSSKASAEDNTVFCDVFKQGFYYTAVMVMNRLRHFGRNHINVGGGPAACAQVSCHTDDGGNTVAVWFCNDDDIGASPSYSDVADLAQIVMDRCVEFGTPWSWIRGQAFDTDLPWNAIVTAQDNC